MITINNNRNVKIFSCFEDNISQKIINYQKKVFDLFQMELNQELTDKSHPDYLDYKINSEDFDIMIFFDIDCIPLKPNLYEYIIKQLSDNNSIIGVEQAANHLDKNWIFAGPACFGITKDVYEKIGKPSFRSSKLTDTAGEITLAAKSHNVNVKLFKIKSSLNKKWKCGKKWFGNGTIYDDWLYHQFELGRYANHSDLKFLEYQFINKCKEIIKKYG